MIIDDGTQVGWEGEPDEPIFLRPFDRIELIRANGNRLVVIVLDCNFKAYRVVAIGERNPEELSGETP